MTKRQPRINDKLRGPGGVMHARYTGKETVGIYFTMCETHPRDPDVLITIYPESSLTAPRHDGQVTCMACIVASSRRR